MKYTNSTRRVHQLLHAIREGTLVPRPEFQRRFVWSNVDQLNFLDTVLQGYPFPEVYVAAGDVDLETAQSTELLVDGQQRITTLYNYFFGEGNLKLPPGMSTFSSLSAEKKVAFLEYQVVVRDLGAMDIEEIVEVFKRINATQYSLNPTEVQHAEYDGLFMQTALEISDSAVFQHYPIFTAQQVRRMVDVEFCLVLISTVMSTYFNRDTEARKFLRDFNDEFEDRKVVTRELNTVFDFAIGCSFERDSRVRTRSNFFTLLVELHRILIREQEESLTYPQVKERIESFFYQLVRRDSVEPGPFDNELVEIYAKAALQATNDRGNRIRRGIILNAVIMGRANDRSVLRAVLNES